MSGPWMLILFLATNSARGAKVEIKQVLYFKNQVDCLETGHRAVELLMAYDFLCKEQENR